MTRCRPGSSGKQRRLATIRAAKAALEAKAGAAAEAKSTSGTGDDERTRRGRTPAPDPAPPKPSAQRNFIDPESRIMKGKAIERGPRPRSIIQADNGQLAVPRVRLRRPEGRLARARVIVACELTDEAVGAGRLVPLVERIEPNLGRRPKAVSADVGDCSEADLRALDDRSIRGCLATGRQKPPATGQDKRRAPSVRAMHQKLRRGGRRSRYRLRRQTALPVFGQIKQARGFRPFLLRGLTKIRAEWALLCTDHTTLRLLKPLPA